MSLAAPSGSTSSNHSAIALLGAITAEHRQGEPLHKMLQVLVEAGDEMGIGGATAHVLRRNTLVQAASAGLPSDFDIDTVLPLITPLPTTDCARLGIPVLLADPAQITSNYPALATSSTISALGALVALPIDRHDRTVGVLSIGFVRRTEFDEDVTTLLRAITRFCAPMREFDHHEALGATVQLQPTSSLNPDDARRLEDLELRLARMEQLLSFVAGTIVQHLDS